MHGRDRATTSDRVAALITPLLPPLRARSDPSSSRPRAVRVCIVPLTHAGLLSVLPPFLSRAASALLCV